MSNPITDQLKETCKDQELLDILDKFFDLVEKNDYNVGLLIQLSDKVPVDVAIRISGDQGHDSLFDMLLDTIENDTEQISIN
ncbi:MAG: hypothetical protein WC783_03930 [Candidatus Paceibacterota bacterium]|jgi:hypothetical protein